MDKKRYFGLLNLVEMNAALGTPDISISFKKKMDEQLA